MPHNTKPRTARLRTPGEAKRTARAAQLVTTNLAEDEREFLATCQQLYRDNQGCTTPFQEFFWNLVNAIEPGNRWPTPEDVRGELKTFTENHEDMALAAENFVARYPSNTQIPAIRRITVSARAS